MSQGCARLRRLGCLGGCRDDESGNQQKNMCKRSVFHRLLFLTIRDSLAGPCISPDTRRSPADEPTSSLSVQSKLVIAFTLLTFLAIALVSAIGYFNARTSLRSAAERQLIGLHRTKVTLLESMLTSLRKETVTLSATDVASRAATEMLAAYRQLDKVAHHAGNAGGGPPVLRLRVRA